MSHKVHIRTNSAVGVFLFLVRTKWGKKVLSSDLTQIFHFHFSKTLFVTFLIKYIFFPMHRFMEKYFFFPVTMNTFRINLRTCHHLPLRSILIAWGWYSLPNPAVCLLHPKAKPVLLSNYRCCLPWSVTQAVPTELLSPLLPVAEAVNILHHCYTSPKKTEVKERTDQKMKGPLQY